MARGATKRGRKAAKKLAKKATKKPVRKTAKKKKAANNKPAKKAAKRPVARAARPRTALVMGAQFAIAGRGANRRLLERIFGVSPPDDADLDPPYDGPSLAGLAARLQREGVPVDTAVIMACDKVKCVVDEMNRVNPAGR